MKNFKGLHTYAVGGINTFDRVRPPFPPVPLLIFHSIIPKAPTFVCVVLLVGTCAPANIGHKSTAEAIKVISRFMALLSINVVRNNRILTEVDKVGMPIDFSI